MTKESTRLIATDPPFNKKRDNYNRGNVAGIRGLWSWDDDVGKSPVESIRVDQPALWALSEVARLVHVKRVIRASSHAGDIALDPYCGSGVTAPTVPQPGWPIIRL